MTPKVLSRFSTGLDTEFGAVHQDADRVDEARRVGKLEAHRRSR